MHGRHLAQPQYLVDEAFIQHPVETRLDSRVQRGPVVRDHTAGGSVRLPDEEAGTVMVFKVYDRISYGLVMEATQALHTEDFVRSPT